LYVNTSTISGAGQGLFTKRALNPNEVIAWYEGPVHRVEDCIDSDYCASRAGVWHVDGKNISRYANDAYNCITMHAWSGSPKRMMDLHGHSSW
jgi:hypothetical protein